MKNTYLILMASFSIFSCTQKQKKENIQLNAKTDVKVTDTTTINGVLLELVDHNGKAELRVNSKKYNVSGNIKISPPCYFLRWVENKVENFSYPDVGVSHSLIILGNIATEEDKKEKNIEKNRICGQSLQGILFRKDSIIITRKALTQSFTCVDTGTDEKDFWGFAHD